MGRRTCLSALPGCSLRDSSLGGTRRPRTPHRLGGAPVSTTGDAIQRVIYLGDERARRSATPMSSRFAAGGGAATVLPVRGRRSCTWPASSTSTSRLDGFTHANPDDVQLVLDPAGRAAGDADGQRRAGPPTSAPIRRTVSPDLRRRGDARRSARTTTAWPSVATTGPRSTAPSASCPLPAPAGPGNTSPCRCSTACRRAPHGGCSPSTTTARRPPDPSRQAQH